MQISTIDRLITKNATWSTPKITRRWEKCTDRDVKINPRIKLEVDQVDPDLMLRKMHTDRHVKITSWSKLEVDQVGLEWFRGRIHRSRRLDKSVDQVKSGSSCIPHLIRHSVRFCLREGTILEGTIFKSLCAMGQFCPDGTIFFPLRLVLLNMEYFVWWDNKIHFFLFRGNVWRRMQNFWVPIIPVLIKSSWHKIQIGKQ